MLRSLGPIVATSIVVLFLLVSAVPLLHWFEADARTESLVENRARWEQLGIVDYRLRVTADCDCGEHAGRALDVTVRDGRVTSLVDRASGQRLPASADVPATVTALFDAAAAAIDAKPDEIVLRYDENYGFPREIRSDPKRGVTGDETEISAGGFDPRPAPGPEADGGAKH